VTRAEILLLTSIHEDAILESVIVNGSEMVQYWDPAEKITDSLSLARMQDFLGS
jgi:hypothetical protein